MELKSDIIVLITGNSLESSGICITVLLNVREKWVIDDGLIIHIQYIYKYFFACKQESILKKMFLGNVWN